MCACVKCTICSCSRKCAHACPYEHLFVCALVRNVLYAYIYIYNYVEVMFTNTRLGDKMLAKSEGSGVGGTVFITTVSK